MDSSTSTYHQKRGHTFFFGTQCMYASTLFARWQHVHCCHIYCQHSVWDDVVVLCTACYVLCQQSADASKSSRLLYWNITQIT